MKETIYESHEIDEAIERAKDNFGDPQNWFGALGFGICVSSSDFIDHDDLAVLVFINRDRDIEYAKLPKQFLLSTGKRIVIHSVYLKSILSRGGYKKKKYKGPIRPGSPIGLKSSKPIGALGFFLKNKKNELKYAVTAGHLFKKKKKKAKVYCGKRFLGKLHKNYYKTPHDIAVIELDKDLKRKDLEFSIDAIGEIGPVSKATPSDLNEPVSVYRPTIRKVEDTSILGVYITSYILGYRQTNLVMTKKATTRGDSGTPLIRKAANGTNEIVGISSFCTNNFSFFTDISDMKLI
ncbi:MAG: S1 family peptidase [bacterium]|nr:S1 family peptidase [bacterium]